MMKRLCIALIVVLGFVFTYCSSGKKAAAAKQVPITYMADIAPLMTTHCTPCHFPPRGNKKPLNTYAAVKDEIDEVIERIRLNPTDKGFMPMKHPKLSDSTINVFVQWKATGLKEQ
jgi:hypothetical protein